MIAFVLRGRPLLIAAGLLLGTALGLTACAMQAVEIDPEAMTRVAAAEPSATEKQAAPAKPKQNIAAAKKQSTYTLAAKEPPPRQAAGQDEAGCVSVENCASVLKAMVASPDRSWVHRPAAPTVLANGVRLFAYRALRPRLDCGELAAALTEVETAAHTFGNPLAGLQPEQMQRVKSLSIAVGGELQDERARRCVQQGKVDSVGSAPPSVIPAEGVGPRAGTQG
jgi:hypothetical protein